MHAPVRFCNIASRAIAVRDPPCVAELAPLLRQGSRMMLDGLAHSADVDDCSNRATEMVAVSAGIERPGLPNSCACNLRTISRVPEAASAGFKCAATRPPHRIDSSK